MRRGIIRLTGPTTNKIDVESYSLDDAQMLTISAAILWASGRETDEQAMDHALKFLRLEIAAAATLAAEEKLPPSPMQQCVGGVKP